MNELDAGDASYGHGFGACQHHGDRPTDHEGETHAYSLTHSLWPALRVRPSVRSPALVRLCARHARALGVQP